MNIDLLTLIVLPKLCPGTQWHNAIIKCVNVSTSYHFLIRMAQMRTLHSTVKVKGCFSKVSDNDLKDDVYWDTTHKAHT